MSLKYYPLFFGKYEKEKKSTSSGSSGGGRNSSVTISTQKEEIYESKDFASLEPEEFIGMGNRSNIKGHFRKKFMMPNIRCRIDPFLVFIKDFFQNTAFVLARHQKTGMPGFYQGTSRHAYTHCFIIRIDGHLIRFPGGKKFLMVGENGLCMPVLSYP